MQNINKWMLFSHFLDFIVHTICCSLNHFNLRVLLSRGALSSHIERIVSSCLLIILIVNRRRKLRLRSLVKVALKKRKYFLFNHSVIAWILLHYLRWLLLLRVVQMPGHCFWSLSLIVVSLIVDRLKLLRRWLSKSLLLIVIWCQFSSLLNRLLVSESYNLLN